MISLSIHIIAKARAMARWMGQASLKADFMIHPEAEVLSPGLSMVSSDVYSGPWLSSTFVPMYAMRNSRAFSEALPRSSSGSWYLHAIPLDRQYPPIP